MLIKLKYILLFSFLFTVQYLFGTHNRAGEINIIQVGDCTESLTVQATIVTYTKASSIPADRDSLTICWGDGTCETVRRSNGIRGEGEFLENDTKKNLYIAIHTYSARGTYRVSMTDPNRNGGILNVNPPNSEQIKFHIQTTYTFLNPQFQGCNDTPELLQPPIDIGCVGRVFTHNPNAYDKDGDSLSYHAIVPLSDIGIEVINYSFPNQIAPGADNNLTINEVTGDIRWDAPQRAGEYNYAIVIVEYREGIPIDTMVRDMQILVLECENLPPEVETSVDEVCVIAGEILEINVEATAPLIESSQRVRLTALGGPFEVNISPATFEPSTNAFLDDPNEKVFIWNTTCEHISDQFYSVVFKATDNFFGDTSGLATLKTVRIKVVGPPPEDVQAEANKEQITVSWEKPYFCEDAADDYFRGFTVWRRLGSNNFPIDSCLTGLAGRGYTKLTPVAIDSMLDGRYYFQDNDVERGRTYCYRILAEFARTTPGGRYTYNTVESLPSEEICIQLGRDVPLLTKVDVTDTDSNNGSIEVCWTKPLAEDLDTLINPGPYVYQVLRGEAQPGTDPDVVDYQDIGVTFVSESFAEANDTCFTDTGLNTAGTAYYYKVSFFVDNETTPLGEANPASSVFLNVAPTDRRNVLSWEERVPWDNYQYVIFRENDLGGFDSIAVVSDPTYTDRELINGVSYCYKIMSLGSYGVEGIISPLKNNSQVACGIPMDDVPPCPPTLTVTNICNEDLDCANEELLFNTLNWAHPQDVCGDEGSDAFGYNIYYAPFEGDEFTLIARIEGANETSFEHKPDIGISGCYAVTAIDTNFNESLFSNIVCVDNCPSYSLPNAFTPNGDGQNDIFKPYPYCFIDEVEFIVFNRWGQKVFETNDPDLNWNGQNLNGEDVPEGTYYYTCKIFERRVTGVLLRPEVYSGWIEVVR